MAREVPGNIPMPTPGHPFSWVTKGAGLLFTAQCPMRPDGTIATEAPVEEQITLALDNLRTTLESAGSSCDNVLQVIVYLCRAQDIKTLDRIYERYFTLPYPSLCFVIVERMGVEGMNIKLTATALAD